MAGKKRKMDAAPKNRFVGHTTGCCVAGLRTKRALSFSCFTCGQVGHMRWDCPKSSLVTGVYPLLCGESMERCDY